MADFTVSALIDSFMQSADAAAARQALGVDVPYTATVTNEATFLAAIAAAEASPSTNVLFYIAGDINLAASAPTLTKNYTWLGAQKTAGLSGRRPRMTRGNGLAFNCYGRFLTIHGIEFVVSNPQGLFGFDSAVFGIDCTVSFKGCKFDCSGSLAGGSIFKRQWNGEAIVQFENCEIIGPNAVWAACKMDHANPGDTTNPTMQLMYVGCSIIGGACQIFGAGYARVSLVGTSVVDAGSGCWIVQSYAPPNSRTGLTVQYDSNQKISVVPMAGSDPITFVDIGLPLTQSTSVSAAIPTSTKAVRFTGSTAGQTLTLPAAVDGRPVRVFNKASVAVDVAKVGADTIDGGAGPVSIPAGQTLLFTAFGADWTTG